ncbi:hypothetical protein Vi05172_g8720 [Venturia inaequalis]|nr:hypothetical protein Vi05172_g8720 [Venturia inaequalis]
MAHTNLIKLLLLALLTLNTVIATPTPTNLAAAEVTAEPDPLLNFKPTLGTCITWCSGTSFTGSCARNFCKDANICVDIGARLEKKGEHDILQAVENREEQHSVEDRHNVGGQQTDEADNEVKSHPNDSTNPLGKRVRGRQLSGTPLSMNSIDVSGSTSCMLYKNAGCHMKDEHLRVGVDVDDLGVWGWGGTAVRSFACVRPN